MFKLSIHVRERVFTLFKTGIVSVTFRKLSAEKIIELVKEAELDGVEWGGDIHAPHGDVERAKEIAYKTSEAGLTIPAYGSYYRVGCDNNKYGPFEAVLASAVALKTKIIRVWAGNKGSNETDDELWDKVILDSKKIAEMAAEEGISIAYEYHKNTLTDTTDSLLKLIKAVNRDNVFSYWQPVFEESVSSNITRIKEMKKYLSNIHVHFFKNGKQQALNVGNEDWQNYFNMLKSKDKENYAMLEFVKKGQINQFFADSKELKRMIKEL